MGQREEVQVALAAWRERLQKARANEKVQARQHTRATARVRHYKRSVAKAQAQLQRLSVQPGARAVAAALRDIGVVDHDNRGRRVDAIERRWGFQGEPWCGMAAGVWLEAAGVKGLTSRVAYCPFILADAQAAHNGFRRVIWHDSFRGGAEVAQKGSVVLFDFGNGDGLARHVGLLREEWRGAGKLKTIEANTSPDDGGSQDNGGGCWKRERPSSLVLAIIAPSWPT